MTRRGMSTSRWIIVDDTDSAIDYNGTWFADRGSLDNVGNFGAPYLSTSHGTNSTGGFSYQFSGTRVLITGSVQFSNPTGQIFWQCFVDNVPFPGIAYTTPENNLDLCELDSLTDGPHTLTVKATVPENQTFWLDYIKYLPSASVPLDTAAISIDATDPGLQFDAGWTSFSPGFETGKTGSKLSFNFTGISLLYYGFFDPSLPVDTSTHTASYSIDGQTAVPFDVLLDAVALTANPTGVQYNKVLFDTGNLTAGQHTLEVMYLGTPETTPLTFEFLVVQNGTVSATSPTTTSVATSNSPAPVPVTSTIQPTSTIIMTVDPTPSTTTTPASPALPTYQSNLFSTLALVTLAVYFLCGRSIRSH